MKPEQRQRFKDAELEEWSHMATGQGVLYGTQKLREAKSKFALRASLMVLPTP